MAALIVETLRRNRLLAVIGFAHVALFLVFIVASFLDPTQILGVNRWLKPMKFAISIAIFTITMAWLLSYLEQSYRAVSVISGIVAVTMSGEIVLITMQALRGVRSHFNQDSPLDMAVFSAMGILILTNTVAAGYAWILFLLRPATIGAAQLSGVRHGLIVFVLASLIGAVMAGRGAHSVGVDDGGPGLPIVNWSTSGGDLRVAHFAGMHALQALPLLGWILDRRRTTGGRRWVQLSALAFTAVTTLLTIQAFAGRSLLALD
ncbi:MAG: hypothetical protein JJE51_03425 [Thermoanaerobaculia bacterium]|nr:hypothetical protein [Thermoanaerobaculia bacterium]